MAFASPIHSSYLPGVPAEAEQPRKSLLVRFVQALAAGRRARAEAEIARFIEERGGRVTDSLEREISRRFGGPAL